MYLIPKLNKLLLIFALLLNDGNLKHEKRTFFAWKVAHFF